MHLIQVFGLTTKYQSNLETMWRPGLYRAFLCNHIGRTIMFKLFRKRNDASFFYPEEKAVYIAHRQEIFVGHRRYSL
jgi:hypothetical protein